MSVCGGDVQLRLWPDFVQLPGSAWWTVQVIAALNDGAGDVPDLGNLRHRNKIMTNVADIVYNTESSMIHNR